MSIASHCEASPTIAFELRYPDGHWVTLYLNGDVKGVPDGTVVVNRLHPLFCYLQEQQNCPEQVRDNLRAYTAREVDLQSSQRLEKT